MMLPQHSISMKAQLLQQSDRRLVEGPRLTVELIQFSGRKHLIEEHRKHLRYRYALSPKIWMHSDSQTLLNGSED
jgi:hypothetical protein